MRSSLEELAQYGIEMRKAISLELEKLKEEREKLKNKIKMQYPNGYAPASLTSKVGGITRRIDSLERGYYDRR